MKQIENPWGLSSDEVMNESQCPISGLTKTQVSERVQTFGTNRLVSKTQEPWYLILFEQFANPLVYILVGAATLKAVVKGITDALVIIAVLIFMALIGFIQEMKARKAMNALLKMSAPKAKVRRNDKPLLIDAAELVPGDLLILDAGDRIAADARIVECANLRVNESTLTGESMPVDKVSSAVAPQASIHDRKNMVFMGTTVSNGRALAVVTAIGMQTEIGHIAEAIQNTGKEITPLQQNVNKLGHSLIWIVLIACIVLAIAGLINGMAWIDVLLLAVAAAVSGIPEGLPAAVTVVLAICVNKMAKRNVIIRKLTSVETLGTATVICTDKTGTLTLNEMTVKEVWLDGRHYTVTGGGYAPNGDFLLDDKKVTDDKTLSKLLGIATLCNDAVLTGKDAVWSILGDPTEGALLTAAAKLGIYKKDIERVQPRLDEISFDSQNQYMATLHNDNGVRTVYVKGSIEKMLPMCTSIETESGATGLGQESIDRILAVNRTMAGKALRVLAVAAAPYPVESGKLHAESFAGKLTFIGLIAMIDPAREEAKDAVAKCKKAGIRVAMITGDNPDTAVAIASQIGICEAGAKGTTSKDIEHLSQEQLVELCKTQTVFARIEPLHKLRIVNAFRKSGHIAAMTGDGVNDAPALEAANIGVSMGITGTDVAKEASDMILVDDNFASIVSAVEEGRIVFNRLRNAVFFLLMTCFSELLTLFMSVLFYGESPLEPIQILWINLVTGAMVAIPLGLEPGTGRELLQPPRQSGVGLIFKGMVFRLMFIALCMSMIVTWLFHHAPIPEGIDGVVRHEVRQTIAFTSIVIFEWLFAFQARSTEIGVLKLGLFKNPWLIVCMFIGLGLQMIVVFLPQANALFKTHPLTGAELAWAALPGIAAVIIESIRKKFSPELFSKGQWSNDKVVK
ncbi:MAG: HAD-IC family P-type ATPase [Fibrobacter sp.]|nr:HAD-IC family P-type ATPase [Fibrobacter sp.]